MTRKVFARKRILVKSYTRKTVYFKGRGTLQSLLKERSSKSSAVIHSKICLFYTNRLYKIFRDSFLYWTTNIKLNEPLYLSVSVLLRFRGGQCKIIHHTNGNRERDGEPPCPFITVFSLLGMGSEKPIQMYSILNTVLVSYMVD